jgi:MYXO-CTERM domain-containing protein
MVLTRVCLHPEPGSSVLCSAQLEAVRFGRTPTGQGASPGRGGPLASTGYDGTSLVPAGMSAGVMALAGVVLLLVRRRRTNSR